MNEQLRLVMISSECGGSTCQNLLVRSHMRTLEKTGRLKSTFFFKGRGNWELGRGMVGEVKQSGVMGVEMKNR